MTQRSVQGQSASGADFDRRRGMEPSFAEQEQRRDVVTSIRIPRSSVSQCGGAAPGVVTGGALPGGPVQRANTKIVTSSWGEDKGKVRSDNASCGARMRAPRAASRAQRLRPIYRANPIPPRGMPVAPDAAD